MEKTATMNFHLPTGISTIKTKISVCVPTYKRPQLLAKLLNTLEAQNLPEGVVLEIIVVDNDADRSAEKVIQEFSWKSIHESKYFVQPQKNISITRNKAVKEASGDLLLFIDDDHYASPNLVKAHLDSMKKYDADVIFGNVQPYFPEDTPAYLRDRELFYSPIRESGRLAKNTEGGSILIKASIIKKYDQPFDIDYGISGGEDTLFYGELSNKGYKLVNSREAVTMEFLPPERTTHKYLYIRAFKGGNCYMRRTLRFNSDKKFFTYTDQLQKASLQVLFYSLKYCLFIFSRRERLKSLLKVYANLGKLTAFTGHIYKGYK